jgi:hypothetical protein
MTSLHFVLKNTMLGKKNIDDRQVELLSNQQVAHIRNLALGKAFND